MASIRLVDGGHNYVAFADIAGYYEQIDIGILRSDLNALGLEHDVLHLLEVCLHRWARVARRGIPQGVSSSDLLGKFYLNTVDLAIADRGLVHRRYVDDYRLFCRSERDARLALALLIECLGSRGLVVQSAKTRIVPGESARETFNQVATVLEPIRKGFLERLQAVGAINSPSATAAQIDQALLDLRDHEPVEVLHNAFRHYFIDNAGTFNKTLLHYLLKRLGSAKDPVALDAALSIFEVHPEETSAMLAYASTVDGVSAVEEQYLAYCGDSGAPYSYQTYQVLRWRLSMPSPPSEAFLRWVRTFAFGTAPLWAIRSAAWAILGKWGSVADLDQLKGIYPGVQSEVDRATLITCLSRMESSRRNSFLGHAAGDGELASRAARMVRQGTLLWDAGT